MMQFKNLQTAVIIWRERQQPRTEDNKALNRSCRPPFLPKQVNLRQHRLTPSLFGKLMATLDQALKDLISRNSATLKCAAIVHASGEVTNRVGDFTAFDEQGLASSVLGPYGDPAGSFHMAAQYDDDRKMLPQAMCQGDLFALLDKPKTDFVVVAFGIKGQDFHEYLRHRKEISVTIEELFGANKP